MAENIADFIPVDGNAVAGDLDGLFAFDVTTARVSCDGCGRVAEIGAVRVYGGAMGSIFRCTNCDTAVFRLVRTPHGFVMDMRGAKAFRVG